MTQVDSWTGCYDKGYKGIIVDAAMAHPAKYSRALIAKIIAHAIDEGWVQPGSTVLDPFAGVACGALPCLQYGLNYVGVELEEKFVTLARENIALWNARYAAHFPNWGTAQVLQGDSRRLCEVVGAAGIVVSSPPYADSLNAGGSVLNPSKATSINDPRGRSNNIHTGQDTIYGITPGQLATLPPGIPPAPSLPRSPAIISSPPFAGNTGGRGEASRNGINAALFDRHSGGMKKGTGDDPANLDHLPHGSIGAVIGSPPFGGVTSGHDSDFDKTASTVATRKNAGPLAKDYGSAPGQLGAMVVGSPPFADSVGSDDPDKRKGLFRDEKRRNDVNLTGTYGETDGQLGAMAATGHSVKAGAVIGSPPYVDVVKGGEGPGARSPKWVEENCNDYDIAARDNAGKLVDYGSTDGQIGATQGQTFWEAARLIVEQCALLLPPGGAAIWVVKGYIKNGQYVDFPGQWQQLCEACGFETVHIHRAMLVKENGEQATMAAGHDTSSSTTNLLGEEVTTAGKALVNKKNRTERKSFFRRLHERRRPDLAIDFETVLCMRKAA